MNPCPHDDFHVDANVERTTRPDGQLISLRLAVEVRCTRCGTPMWFPTHSTGESHRVATTDPSGRKLTVPLVPVGQVFKPDPLLPNVTTRNTDLLKGQP